MPRKLWNTRLKRFVRTATCFIGAWLVGGGALAPRVNACGYFEDPISVETSFDPDLGTEPGESGLQFDPLVPGFGGPCGDCARDARRADWARYFDGAISGEDWDKALLDASLEELTMLRRNLSGRGVPSPALSPIVKAAAPALRDRLLRAVRFARAARETESCAHLAEEPIAEATATVLRAMLATGRADAEVNKDPFLVQRYAFLQLRLTFYLRAWPEVIAAVRTAQELQGPSNDLWWRARYYRAGALRRDGQLAEANLELARIHAAWPALSTVTGEDFQPQEDADWRRTLSLAADDKERAALWRLVGLKLDGVAAAQEIFKLEPKSSQLAVLVVRELSKIEGKGTTGAAALEAVTVSVAQTPGADRPWLMQLASGHLAALRGDLMAARGRLAAAVALRPNDNKVAAQANASLAVALARRGRLDGASTDELARALHNVGPQFARDAGLDATIRGELAAAFTRSGRLAEAELVFPRRDYYLAQDRRWRDAVFVQRMITRTNHTETAFDRFLLTGSYRQGELERELALIYLLSGQFAKAEQHLKAHPEASPELGTNPFATRIVDCHDCDALAHASDGWTLASFAARLASLRVQAAGKGPAAAQAALELGTGLYNLTWFGNARVVVRDSHQPHGDLSAAAPWFRRAYAGTTEREVKAEAAFLAAKVELMMELAKVPPYTFLEEDLLPVPKTWYPVLQGYSDTFYYGQVLAECGAFRAWVAKTQRQIGKPSKN